MSTPSRCPCRPRPRLSRRTPTAPPRCGRTPTSPCSAQRAHTNTHTNMGRAVTRRAAATGPHHRTAAHVLAFTAGSADRGNARSTAAASFDLHTRRSAHAVGTPAEARKEERTTWPHSNTQQQWRASRGAKGVRVQALTIPYAFHLWPPQPLTRGGGGGGGGCWELQLSP